MKPATSLLLNTTGSSSGILIRLMVGAVFLSEGIQKFLFPDQRGAGRFEKIGLPEPELLSTLVGSFEIVCSILVLIGLFTRMAVIPLLIIMLVAIYTTKAQIFLEEGFWSTLHASRTDWSMLLGSLFLLITGGSKWSLDYYLSRKG